MVNISIKEEAYSFLKAFKSKDKSFSDVILDFKEKRGSFMDFFGALKDTDWNDRENSMKDFRRSFSKRLQ